MARVAVIGGGPAGLAAAEVLGAAGVETTVFEAMPTVGRKFLLAGKSGLNLTHSEDLATVLGRYPGAPAALVQAVEAFPPSAIRDWAAGLGIETFTGSSGRVFPTMMKASPLLRAWIGRLAEQGVTVRTRHRWTGFRDGLVPEFQSAVGPVAWPADAVLLALGGASWPQLGSDGAWVPALEALGAAVEPLTPSNCGFDTDWSEHFASRNHGLPVKSVTMTVAGRTLPGEFMVTTGGIEGGLVYAHAAALRALLSAGGPAVATVDLAPGRSLERLTADLGRPRGKASASNHLRKATGIDGVKSALIRECAGPSTSADPARLAALIKALPIAVTAPRPIAEAISSAGGVRFAGLDDRFMVVARPGLFVAGEMVDWDAPTGGYLLTACLATGRAAAEGILAHLGR